MTIIELLFFAFRLGLSILLTSVLWRWHPIAGGATGLFFFFIFPKTAALLVKLLGDKPRGKPICSNGLCRDKDYIWVRSVNGRPACRCKCGIDYIISGKCFMRLDSNDKPHEYMIWSKENGWVVDK